MRVTAERRRWMVFLGLATTVVVLDQLVKSWILGNFEVGVPVEIVGDWLRIALTHNSGAIFGMFGEQAMIFAAFSVAVIGLIVWYHGHGARGLLMSVALGLLLGGAIGNLIDRLRYGYVADFVDMGIGGWRFYTYNVADAAITTSILLILLIAFVPGLAERSSDA